MVSDQESVRLIFGLKVKSLRQQLGLNYQQLSAATGMAVSYLHDIENGKKYPKADKIITLAKVLKVDYDYLVSLTGNKRLQPIIDLLNSDFIQMMPWEHFGLSPASLLELFANTPDKITAFISTLLKLSRSIQMSKENFYTSALRSYQDLHDNYFPDIEEAVKQARLNWKIDEENVPSVSSLEELLLQEYGVKIDRKLLGAKDVLKKVRSYYAPQKKKLYINKSFASSQEKFLIARELAFHFLQLEPRPLETILLHPASFEVLLNNFKASYFASALLMPEDHLTEAIQQVTRNLKWHEKEWVQLLQKYDVTPEMLMQRLTNLLPAHFGIDQLFFLRMSGNMDNMHFEMTKELHLSQLHSPYANVLQEHYCRRWIAIHAMEEVHKKVQTKKYKQPIVLAQISQYWQTHNRYFCITFAKPSGKNPSHFVSVTLGILIDPRLAISMPFVNDSSVPVRTVHTTCERCGITDCAERAAPPVFIESQKQEEMIAQALEQLK